MNEETLKAIEVNIANLGRTTPRACDEREVLVSIAAAQPALLAEVRRLREALASIRSIETYVGGRPCTCSGIGCVECIANLTLEGREKELFS